MNLLTRIPLVIKALPQLGGRQVKLYTLYQLGLRTGHFQRKLNEALARLSEPDQFSAASLYPCLEDLPDCKTLVDLLGHRVNHLLKDADEIIHGYVHLFGGNPVPLELSLSTPLKSWIKYEISKKILHDQDIKFIWEPGRFGWACTLAMAYHLTNDERYAESFWQYTEEFLSSNPPYLGPHWSSAQEAAIRLVILAFTTQVFSQSKHTTPERLELIGRSIAIHAERIPTTLVYARAQNNNHLITEALGLYTASAVLPEHPLAAGWHKLGWEWLIYALTNQISLDGTYVQQSTNYHRLMLQSALWAYTIQQRSYKEEPFPGEVISRLEAATRWLWSLIDPHTGRVPNMGHNDGAYILPFTASPHDDYRPVIHAASRVFLQCELVPQGPWDDMSAWLRLPLGAPSKKINLSSRPVSDPHKDSQPAPPFVLINPSSDSWATLRVAHFDARPAHADQLHLDLWWHGLNIAQDAGTYTYNAQPPWDNSLTTALVHNTVTLDGLDTMQRAGRFLYLDWAQGSVIASQLRGDGTFESISAQHDGYQSIRVAHSRIINPTGDGHWHVMDLLDGSPEIAHVIRLHWLLPDWEYETYNLSTDTKVFEYEVRLHSPHGRIGLKISSPSAQWKDRASKISFQIARAGKILSGEGSVLPITGWISPTYGVKIPALACIFQVTQALPIELKSEWILPRES